MREISAIENDLDTLESMPPHTCSEVDRMLKRLQGEERDADAAADRTEDADARKALVEASTAIGEAYTALDDERDVVATIRAGCDARESVARAALRECEERDERIATLEAERRATGVGHFDREMRIQMLEAEIGEREGLVDTAMRRVNDYQNHIANLEEIIEFQRSQQAISQRVIGYLSEKIRKSWLTKLADAGKRLWWERKARGRAKTIRHLRLDKAELHALNSELFDALLLADGVFSEQEWEQGPFGQKWCPSCHVIDERVWGPYPNHLPGCRIGSASEAVRGAIQGSSREQGINPRHVLNGRRDFPA